MDIMTAIPPVHKRSSRKPGRKAEFWLTETVKSFVRAKTDVVSVDRSEEVSSAEGILSV